MCIQCKKVFLDEKYIFSFPLKTNFSSEYGNILPLYIVKKNNKNILISGFKYYFKMKKNFSYFHCIEMPFNNDLDIAKFYIQANKPIRNINMFERAKIYLLLKQQYDMDTIWKQWGFYNKLEMNIYSQLNGLPYKVKLFIYRYIPEQIIYKIFLLKWEDFYEFKFIFRLQANRNIKTKWLNTLIDLSRLNRMDILREKLHIPEQYSPNDKIKYIDNVLSSVLSPTMSNRLKEMKTIATKLKEMSQLNFNYNIEEDKILLYGSKTNWVKFMKLLKQDNQYYYDVENIIAKIP